MYCEQYYGGVDQCPTTDFTNKQEVEPKLTQLSKIPSLKLQIMPISVMM